MKTAMLLTILFLASTASIGQDLQRRVTADLPPTSLRQVLTHLREKEGLKFSYNDEQIPKEKIITLPHQTTTLGQLLQNICTQAGLLYEIVSDQVVLKARKPASFIINGTVTDSSTGLPIPLASVVLEKSPEGTMTNEEGQFVLSVSAQPPGVLTFSCVGYRSFRRPWTAAERSNLIIKLEPEAVHLSPVIFQAKTGLSILQEARARIHENYDTGAVNYTLFVRDLTRSNDEPIGVSEAVHKTYQGKSNNTTLRQISLVKGRRAKDYATYQKILTAFPRWTGFDLWIDLQAIFQADLARPGGDSFLNSKFMQRHDFELLGTSRLNDREVYVIAFDQSDRYKNQSLYKGKLYIDSESMAFVRIESALSPKGIRHAKFFGTHRAMAVIFGFAECKIEDIKTSIDYVSLQGRWYVRHIAVDASYFVAKTRKSLAAHQNLTGSITVTDIDTTHPAPLTADEIMTPHDFRYRLYLYDKSFWQGYTTIPTDLSTEDAFAHIHSKNQRTPPDLNFWKHYQPYKNNPQLLPRVDSLQAPAPAEKYATNPAPVEIPTPRYEPLSRTRHTAHFILAHTPVDSITAITLGRILEENYSRILSDFQLTSLPEAVLVEIYPSVDAYHFAIGQPDAPPSDAGMATGNTEFKIVSPRNPGAYHSTASLELGAVHEFSHCAHYCLIATLDPATQNTLSHSKENPWLFEALACYEAGQFYEPTRFEYLCKGEYPSLQTLNDVETNGKVYDVGFVLIDYILKTFGREKLLALVHSNGAIRESLGISDHALETGFAHYMHTHYGLTQK